MKMANLKCFVIANLLLLGTFIPYAAAADTGVSYVPGDVILKVQLGVSIDKTGDKVTSNDPELSAVLNKYHAKDVEELFPFDKKGTLLSRTYKLVFDKKADLFSIIADLYKVECIDYAHLNYIAKPSAIPNDSSWSKQWGQQKIDCQDAWDLFTGSDNIVVAVVDTGIDYNHPDLADNIWINQAEIPDNGLDDDNNGYVDDYYGYDFANNDSDPIGDDNNQHGTHVAGIIGAVANNSTGLDENITGVMWNCRLMALKAGGDMTGFTSVDIDRAIRYAVDNGAEVINMSFGGYSSADDIQSAIEYAHNNGVLLVAAAGNDNTNYVSYPAGYDNVIAVAATDQNDAKASFSNFGTWVDISAPGVSILSTVPNDKYENFSGTSMACPMVSGVCGLVLGYADSLSETLNPAQVEFVLLETADNIDEQNPSYVGYLGAGRVNAYKALDYINEANPISRLVSIEIFTQDDQQPTEVTEYDSLQLKATGYYDDGSQEDLTDQVTWVVRPVKYGKFNSSTPGKFLASGVSADREVVVTAYIIKPKGGVYPSTMIFKNYRVITVKNNSNAEPLAIEGDDSIPAGSAVNFTAELLGSDVTSNCQWSVTQGREYATFDSSVPGRLVVKSDAATGQKVKIKAIYIDSDTRVSYTQEKEITVAAPASKQVAGLFITGRSSVTAGSTLTVRAWIAYQGQTQLQEVTSDAIWTPTAPDTAGGYFTQPGTFLATNVSEKTSVTLTAYYTVSGTTYNASVTVDVLPATPACEYIDDSSSDNNDNSEIASQDANTDNDDSSENNIVDDLDNLLNSVPCSAIGTIVIALVMFAGFTLIKED